MHTPRTRAERRAATADRILDAARAEFGERGERATIRGIAHRAEVDPSLVLQHYGSKDALFRLAVRPDTDLEIQDVPTHLAEVLRDRLDGLPPSTRALMRSMLTSETAAVAMRDFLQERAENLARVLDGADAETRAALVVSSIMGITIARHFLELEPLTDVDDAQLAGLTESWLTPPAFDSDLPGASPSSR